MTDIENKNQSEESKNTNDISESWINELKNIESDENAWKEITSWLNEANISDPDNKYKSEFIQPENNEFLKSVEYSPEEYQNLKFDILWLLRTNLKFSGYNNEWKNKTSPIFKQTDYKDKKNLSRYWDNFVDTDTLIRLGNDIIQYNPETIKTWIIAYNTKLAKDQLFIDSWKWNIVTKNIEREKWLSQKKPINIEAFMKHFNEDQKQTLTIYENKTIFEPVQIEPRSKDQKIGEFIMIPESKNQILTNFQRASNIMELTITGKADATLPETEKPNKQVEDSIKILEEKWLTANIKNVQIENGEIISTQTFLNNIDDKNKLNQTWAYARALMQIESLPAEQIQKINNCPNFKIKINAQDINKWKKGDEYTWGSLEIISDWNTKIVKEPSGIKEFNENLPNANINLWTISFNTTIGLTKNINITLDKNGNLKLSEFNRWGMWAASSWFWNNNVHSTIDGSILYDENKVKELDNSKTIWISRTSTSYDNLNETWVYINQNIDLQKDLWLKIKRDVAWSWWFHTEWIKRDSIDWTEFNKNFNQYLSNIEKNPDKFISLLSDFIKDSATDDAQRIYLKKIIKNIEDAKKLNN